MLTTASLLQLTLTVMTKMISLTVKKLLAEKNCCIKTFQFDIHYNFLRSVLVSVLLLKSVK